MKIVNFFAQKIFMFDWKNKNVYISLTAIHVEYTWYTFKVKTTFFLALPYEK